MSLVLIFYPDHLLKGLQLLLLPFYLLTHQHHRRIVATDPIFINHLLHFQLPISKQQPLHLFLLIILQQTVLLIIRQGKLQQSQFFIHTAPVDLMHLLSRLDQLLQKHTTILDVRSKLRCFGHHRSHNLTPVVFNKHRFQTRQQLLRRLFQKRR